MNKTMNRKEQFTRLLQDYTRRQENPDRVGCPTFEMLEAFLNGQLDQDMAIDFCDHLPRCQECLLELKTLRDIIREEIRITDEVKHKNPAKDVLEVALV